MASSTLADLFSMRTRPQIRHEVTLRRVTYRLTGDWLERYGNEVPFDAGARLSTYIVAYQKWREEVGAAYERAIDRLQQLKRKDRRAVSLVAQQAGVSSKRIGHLKDPEKQEQVYLIVALMTD